MRVNEGFTRINIGFGKANTQIEGDKGIRYHTGITAVVMRLLGKTSKVKIGEEVYQLNQKSFNKWKDKFHALVGEKTETAEQWLQKAEDKIIQTTTKKLQAATQGQRQLQQGLAERATQRKRDYLVKLKQRYRGLSNKSSPLGKRIKKEILTLSRELSKTSQTSGNRLPRGRGEEGAPVIDRSPFYIEGDDKSADAIRRLQKSLQQNLAQAKQNVDQQRVKIEELRASGTTSEDDILLEELTLFELDQPTRQFSEK